MSATADLAGRERQIPAEQRFLQVRAGAIAQAVERGLVKNHEGDTHEEETNDGEDEDGEGTVIRRDMADEREVNASRGQQVHECEDERGSQCLEGAGRNDQHRQEIPTHPIQLKEAVETAHCLYHGTPALGILSDSYRSISAVPQTIHCLWWRRRVPLILRSNADPLFLPGDHLNVSFCEFH